MLVEFENLIKCTKLSENEITQAFFFPFILSSIEDFAAVNNSIVLPEAVVVAFHISFIIHLKRNRSEIYSLEILRDSLRHCAVTVRLSAACFAVTSAEY